MAAQSFFDSIASVLSGIARRHGMEPKLLEHKLLKNWPEIAGEQVAAFVVPADHADPPDPQELLAFAGGRLAAFKRPRLVRYLEALPRNALGKVLKHELRG